MDPTPQPQPNYDFIMQAPQKAPRFGGVGGGGDKAQRIKVVAMGALGLIIIVVILLALLGGSGNKGNASLIDLAAYQTELSRVVAIGSTDATSSSVKATAQTAAATLTSDLTQTQTLLKKRGVKLSAKKLTVYHSSAIDTQLASAKQANTFDETYKQLFSEKMTNYQKKLSEVYAAQDTTTAKTTLKSFNEHAKLLSFDYKTQ